MSQLLKSSGNRQRKIQALWRENVFRPWRRLTQGYACYIRYMLFFGSQESPRVLGYRLSNHCIFVFFVVVFLWGEWSGRDVAPVWLLKTLQVVHIMDLLFSEKKSVCLERSLRNGEGQFVAESYFF